MIKQRGFTLIEVMVAIAITAVVAVMAYYGVDSAIRLNQSLQTSSDDLTQMNRAFAIMQRDFQQAVGRTVRDPQGYGKKSAFILNKNEQPMLYLSRTGWTNPAPARFQRSQLERVAYDYDGEKLWRISWQMMDRYDDSKEQKIVLFDHVSAFTVRALKPSEASQLNNLGSNVFVNLPQSADQQQWLEAWPYQQDAVNSQGVVEASRVLPMAVEVTITLAQWGEIKRRFELAEGAGNGI